MAEKQQSEEKKPAGPRLEGAELKTFLALAHKRFDMAAEAEGDWRRDGLDDLKFSLGDQWNETEKRRRNARNAPCLTMNHIGQSVKQVTNAQRQQRPAPQISPNGKGATKEIAEILQGSIRHVYNQSDGDIAHDTASEYATRTGRGWWRLIAKYPEDDPEAKTQEIYIEAGLNPFALYSDPRCQKADRSDAMFKFIVTYMTHEEYRDAYPKSDLAQLSDMAAVGDQAPGWASTDSIGGKDENGDSVPVGGIRVAEYYWIELKEIKRANGDKSFKRIVHWSKINAIEELDHRILPGTIIPVFEITGTDLIVDGKRYLAGIVRDAKDPSRLYNFEVSAMATVLQKIPKSPVIGPRGAFTDAKWNDANTEDYSYLEYETVDANGNPITAEHLKFNTFSADLGALATMAQIASSDIKATTSIYEASLGQERKDESGVAIKERKQQGENANYDYADNLIRGVRLEARVLLSWIPYYYDAPQIRRIINPDESHKNVVIYNSQSATVGEPDSWDEETMQELSEVKEMYDVGVGRYDVAITVGPSVATKRQLATATQVELMAKVPIVQQAAPDIVIANMDIPQADAIAKRVKKLLPPQLQDDGQGTAEQQLQKTQAQLAQISQQHEILVQQLNQANEIIKTKQVEMNAKAAIDKYRADLQAYTQITVAEINTKMQKDQVRTELEAEAVGDIGAKAHEVGMEAMRHAHARDLAQQGHQNALEQGDQSHRNTVLEAEQGHRHSKEQAEQANEHATDQAVTSAALQPQPAEAEEGEQ